MTNVDDPLGRRLLLTALSQKLRRKFLAVNLFVATATYIFRDTGYAIENAGSDPGRWPHGFAPMAWGWSISGRNPAAEVRNRPGRVGADSATARGRPDGAGAV
ncbi:hypothetical protein [Paenirhodobacter populi]|uniref:Uncharacterized protein n=1 Tax=Paenirhodobacter populi TaxID=2306993 RepID=A0A443JSR3_9RHOB|nr:hypothetical protein [Sinirhodobacter populi]RWR23516.1 hypothetical protein D2T30_03460 [Sinirhodobacter populi]